MLRSRRSEESTTRAAQTARGTPIAPFARNAGAEVGTTGDAPLEDARPLAYPDVGLLGKPREQTLLRGGSARRRIVALGAYYAFVLTVVLPMSFSPEVGASAVRTERARVSLSVAMRTPRTTIATLVTPFPALVTVSPQGKFTIRSQDLAFASIPVPMVPADAAIGTPTVRAAATTDLSGTIDAATGAVTLDGAMMLLWSVPLRSGQPLTTRRMVDCPVGPFLVQLSTTAPGGSGLDASRGTATLVDGSLNVPAVPSGKKECDSRERAINAALSLPILPPQPSTTTTSTTLPSSTSTTDSTTTTTTTTVAPTPGTPPVFGFPLAAIQAAAITAAPMPSIISTLAISTVTDPPPSTNPPPSTTTSTVAQLPPPTAAGTPPVVRAKEPRHATAPPGRKIRPRHTGKTRKPFHPVVKTRSSANMRSAVATPADPAFGGGPFDFLPSPHLSHSGISFVPTPMIDLGAAAIAAGNSGAGRFAILVILLLLPVAFFGFKLVASDFGWHIPLKRRRKRVGNRKSPA